MEQRIRALSSFFFTHVQGRRLWANKTIKVETMEQLEATWAF